MPSLPLEIPPICPRCEIPKFTGFKHRDLEECYTAMRAYLKVYQDDLEKTRMESFQHPTRDEMLNELLKFAQYMDATAGMLKHLSEYIQGILHGTLVPYAQSQGYDLPAERRRYNDFDEGLRSAQDIERNRTKPVPEGLVRAILSPDVPDAPQGVVQDQERKNLNADNLGA